MAPDEKPYRVYRGGRAKGKVPTAPRSGRQQGAAGGSRGGARSRRGARRVPRAGRAPRRSEPHWGRRIGLGVLVVLVLVIVWAVASWFAFSSGVSDANKRLDPDAKAALDHQSGLLLSHSTTILMLGTDNNAKLASRAGDMHSDSIMLLRTDPSHHRLYYLSIPRDLQVAIPGSSTQKINAAFQIGGAALAIKTIRQFTGLDINHVDGRQLRRLQGSDRRDSAESPSTCRSRFARTASTARIATPGALRQVAGLALPQGLRST